MWPQRAISKIAVSQLESPKKILRAKRQFPGFIQVIQKGYLKIRRRRWRRDPMALSLGIDVGMVERYLEENEELRAKAEGEGQAGNS